MTGYPIEEPFLFTLCTHSHGPSPQSVGLGGVLFSWSVCWSPEMVCPPPPDQTQGSRRQCPEPFLFTLCTHPHGPSPQSVGLGSGLLSWSLCWSPEMACPPPPDQTQGSRRQCPEPFLFTLCTHPHGPSPQSVGLGGGLFRWSVCWSPEMACPTPPDQTQGSRRQCPEPFRFGSECTFQCDTGYVLPSGGTNSIHCIAIHTEGDRSITVWDLTPTPCTGAYPLPRAHVSFTFITLSLGQDECKCVIRFYHATNPSCT